MTIGIYCIRHGRTGRRYIGKSVNVEARLSTHKYHLTRSPRDPRKTNRHLWNAVRKYGWGEFETWTIEAFDETNEALIAERELYWMDALRTCDRQFGFNIRRDSQTSMVVHEETRRLISAQTKGEANPNFGNFWSDDQRENMRQSRLSRADRYGDEWRDHVGAGSRLHWAANPEKRATMGAKIAEIKRTYDFLQLDLDGRLIRIWDSVLQIEQALPGFCRQPIYSVCHGWKKTYRGFSWRQVPKSLNIRHLLLMSAA